VGNNCCFENQIKYVNTVLAKCKSSVTFKISVLPNTNSCRKIPIEIHFVYLGNKDIYCILKA
jgi:hypothetical protein